MSEKLPPPEVQAAAKIVNDWLAHQETARVSEAEFQKMSARDRIEYCRRFDQRQFK
jgi:hypothetical protein